MMAENDKNEQRLQYIFDKVNEWLKFIELKNAAMLTFSTTMFSFLISFLKNFSKLSFSYRIMAIIACAFLFLVITMSLYSFYVKLSRGDFANCLGSDQKNLIFYGDLQQMSMNEYRSQLDYRYKTDNYIARPLTGFNEYEMDLMNQILINSRIAMKKGACFNRSVKIIFLGILLEIAVFVLICSGLFQCIFI